MPNERATQTELEQILFEVAYAHRQYYKKIKSDSAHSFHAQKVAGGCRALLMVIWTTPGLYKKYIQWEKNKFKQEGQAV